MSQERSTLSGKSLFQSEPKMTTEEKNLANKTAKGAKKDIKEIAKTSKELMEEMVKTNRENNEKIEDKLDNVGTKIARAVTGEVRDGMEQMAKMLGGIMEKMIDQNEKINKNTEKMINDKKMSQEKTTQDELKIDTPTARQIEEDDPKSQEDTQDESLPNAQSKFRTMTQDETNELRRENKNLKSNLEELIERKDRQEDKIKIIESKLKTIKNPVIPKKSK